MMVRRSLTEKMEVPRHLIIDSCNLQLNEQVGQGTSEFTFCHWLSISLLRMLGEDGVVYKGRMARHFNTGFSQVVAVKTLKGTMCCV